MSDEAVKQRLFTAVYCKQKKRKKKKKLIQLPEELEMKLYVLNMYHISK